MHDLAYVSDINSVSKSVSLKEDMSHHYRIQVADVNFKVVE